LSELVVLLDDFDEGFFGHAEINISFSFDHFIDYSWIVA